jgi:SAM-dependent methyltransferase
MPDMTWEEAVLWLRAQPDKQELARACYFDVSLLDAAQRFAGSDEWQAVRALLPSGKGKKALDLGAGRGISSYALARDGWQVTALEPDPSPVVGAGAIRALAEEAGLSITVVEEYGETLPFDDATFHLVYGRQVLHHARDLPALCREVGRVLRPGGRFIATREHVLSHPDDLATFLANHPLHHLYGGEHAYLLAEYQTSIINAGLHLMNSWGPFDSVINYFPLSYQEWWGQCTRPLRHRIGVRPTRWLANPKHPPGRWVLQRLARRLSHQTHTPGRLYSFMAQKD